MIYSYLMKVHVPPTKFLLKYVAKLSNSASRKHKFYAYFNDYTDFVTSESSA